MSAFRTWHFFAIIMPLHISRQDYLSRQKAQFRASPRVLATLSRANLLPFINYV